MYKNKKQYVGFTLVELLVVISIIALMISVLLPALSASREAAMSAECRSNLRQFGIAINLYTTDHAGVIYITHAPYYDARKAYYPYLSTKWNVSTNATTCPTARRDGVLPSHYGMNSRLSGAGWITNDRLEMLANRGGVGVTRYAIYIDSMRKHAVHDPNPTQVAYRHNDTANVLFLDSHVAAGSLENYSEIWTLGPYYSQVAP